MDNKTNLEPHGATIIYIFTILAFVAPGWFSFVLLALSAFWHNGLTLAQELLFYFPLILALLGLVSLGILHYKVVRRLSWFFLVSFWIILFAFFVWYDYPFLLDVGITYYSGPWQLTESWQYAEIGALMLPLVYSLSCLIYFQTSRVKRYFCFGQTALRIKVQTE